MAACVSKEIDERKAEARQHRRVRIPGVLVHYRSAVGRFLVGDALDFSREGVFVSGAPLAVGRLIDLELFVFSDDDPVRAVGRVMWTRSNDEGEERPVGMGVKLVDMDETSHARFEHLVTMRQPTLLGLGEHAAPPMRAPEPSRPFDLVAPKKAAKEPESLTFSLVRRRSGSRRR
jgi:hypothetical protein